MKDYLNEVNELYPIRKNAEQKSAFFDYVCDELGEERVKKETFEKKHENIIIGDIESARVVFTAHYDTPATSLVPNLMFPADKLKGMVFHLGYPIITAILCLLVAYGIGALLSLDQSASLIIYVVLYLGFFYCSTRLITNKHNRNDNTSGVATILSIAGSINNDKVAFVLLDNEEKGLLGSKALNKKYKKLFENKLVVNFDCVGNGDQIIVMPKEGAEKLSEYALLKEALTSDDKFELHYIPFKKSLGNSDHKSFPCGVGVVASHRAKLVKFCTGRIHTNKDTIANSENILFLTDKIEQFVEKL